MKFKAVVFVCILLVLSLSMTVLAKGPKKNDPQPQDTTLAPVDIQLYLSKAGLTQPEQSALFYYLSLSGMHARIDDVVAFWRLDLSGFDVTLRLGFPLVLLDGEILVWRHPPVLHSPFPVLRERYRYRWNHAWGKESVDWRPGRYEYTYENKVRGITEKIEVKPQKYSYSYESSSIEEKLELQLAAHKYEYKYKNRLTGEEIKRSGSSKMLNWKEVPQYLSQQPFQQAPGPNGANLEFNFKLEFNLNFD